ncbi:hypothetical protein HN592_05695 [Candidatus Woesearchaeota archaeon]|jgi:tRNA (guanine26-N2/guanine27-N2)-dimethyltransferase|nr:hypothetical protein [Candidatus Woesearchaeota archaeon]MBT3304749.1 hypothetical protein [Candidatus Woesearchaeota archaeon]MBT4367915.1 hypothetical protein [Candidatus Woesearchaeota archaeon]MBT4712403.1 hypothetical protein [Candidatus Woesearchaeota archaeon]MBT6639315.1 hypothetical protein [Candidatus Woesearchaeota archaeon]
MKTIKEGNTSIYTYESEKVSKDLPVFYNEVMKLNRDLSILLLNSINKHLMQIALPLSGTGIRGLRFMRELKADKIQNISFNDNSPEAIKLIKDNFKLNNLKHKALRKKRLVYIENQDANLFLLNSTGFDYIDIDPFGPPTPFLDASIKRLAREGILAVTATDTSALSGTYPKACKRKYWATPNRNAIMHEIGLRILIRRVQLIGVSHQKALTPIFSYSKDHYMRVFFTCLKSKDECDNIIKQHDTFNDAGPLWTGQLWNHKLVKAMLKECEDKETKQFLTILEAESKIEQVGFYQLHSICKKEKLTIPNFTTLIEKIKKAGFKVARTHFSDKGIRSNISYEELVNLLN